MKFKVKVKENDVTSIAKKHRKHRESMKAQSRLRVQSAKMLQTREEAVVQGPTLPIPANKQLFSDDVWVGDHQLPITSLGSGLRLMDKRMINFTQTLAKDLLDPAKYEVFAPDRPFNKAHANYLLLAMRQDTFRWEQLQLIVCSCKGKTYRMNGQHSCWARLYFVEEASNPSVQFFHYSADTENDMRILYASIDRGKHRTKGNVIQSYLYDSEKFKDYSKDCIRRVAEGFGYWKWGYKQASHHSADEIAYLMETDYYGLTLKVANFYQTYCLNEVSKHVKRSPTVAAMFATFDKHEQKAIEFWEGVRSGANLSASDTRLKLRNRLMTYAVNAGRGGGSYKQNVGADDMYAWCIQSWNAYREGKPMLRGFLSAASYKNMPKPV